MLFVETHDFVRKPEYAVGAHVAPLGLAFVTGGERLGPNYANGAFIARHGSWNRKPLSGYDVVFVRFDDRGNVLPNQPIPVLTGFLTKDDKAKDDKKTPAKKPDPKTAAKKTAKKK